MNSSSRSAVVAVVVGGWVTVGSVAGVVVPGPGTVTVGPGVIGSSATIGAEAGGGDRLLTGPPGTDTCAPSARLPVVVEEAADPPAAEAAGVVATAAVVGAELVGPEGVVAVPAPPEPEPEPLATRSVAAELASLGLLDGASATSAASSRRYSRACHAIGPATAEVTASEHTSAVNSRRVWAPAASCRNDQFIGGGVEIEWAEEAKLPHHPGGCAEVVGQSDRTRAAIVPARSPRATASRYVRSGPGWNSPEARAGRQDGHVEASDPPALPPVDALLVVSFGGPEGPDDVVPFLENVTRGRGIPRERLVEVGAHYQLFGGRSPINDQNRALIAALRTELDAHGRAALPIYWGNRNWSPYLTDTVAQMAADGVRNALAFVTSAYSSYSGCRQYREDIEAARVAAGPGAPTIGKLRAFFNHPGFVEPLAAGVRRTLDALPAERRARAHLAFCAHSVPMAMATTSDYVTQLEETMRLVVDRLDDQPSQKETRRPHALVWQSRSGPPQVPWLEPDIGDHLATLAGQGVDTVVLVPLGFISDHMEVVYDLDHQAMAQAEELGLLVRRAPTVGTDPQFVTMIRLLVEERCEAAPVRLALGRLGPRPDVCAQDCCPAPPARPVGAPGGGRPGGGRPGGGRPGG